jgi:TatD DNase family protein
MPVAQQSPEAGSRLVTLADTHCHLDLEVFDADRQAVMARAAAAGVTRVLVPSLDSFSAGRVLALTREYSQLFAAVGIHPTAAEGATDADVDEVRLLAAQPKTLAIGEIGLDYFWVKDPAARARQRSTLRAQLSIARRANLPVVLHMREAGDAEDGECSRDLLAILAEWVAVLRSGNEPLADRPGVLHSFSGSLETAQRAILLGFWIGVTGPITYKSAERRRQVVAGLPLDRLLIETDAPFLSPQAHRGQRNEPAYVGHIADKIAQVQARTPREVAYQTSANAARLLAWGDAF